MKSQSNDPRGGSGETKISVTGQSEEEKAVWKTLGDGNEDMVECEPLPFSSSTSRTLTQSRLRHQTS